MRISWSEYGLRIARVAALRSEDPYTKVGACVLRKDNTVAGVGYNGPPPGIDIDWSDRDLKNEKMVHAEVNCLKYCVPGNLNLIAITHSPCNRCLAQIAAYGIKTIIFEEYYHRDNLSNQLCKDFGIELQQIKL